jgi:putative SOS response-associated peptidase YedK
MCGKFTAMASWSEAAFFSALEAGEILASSPDDHEVIFRVMNPLPLVVWDKEKQARRVIAARWGFPHPLDWRRPQPIHARAETIDGLSVFADAFAGKDRDSGRGLVLVKSFNEAPDSGEQHVFEPEAYASAIAFVWKSFNVGAAAPLIACCMVTVPANQLIASLPTDRMPAIIEPEDWAKWIGEEPASLAGLKAMLKTKDGLNWTMRREHRAKATLREPTGMLF